MLSFLLDRYRSVKFKTKILCIVGVIALIPTILLFGYFTKQIMSLQNREIDNLHHSFEQQVNSINQLMDKAMSNALKISTNTEISNFFCLQSNVGEYVLEYIKVLRPLLSYIQEAEAPEMSAIRFYTRNENLFSNLTVQNIYKSQNADFFDEIAALLEDTTAVVRLSSQGRSYYLMEYSTRGSLSIFLPILTPASSKTFLEYELSFDSIFQSLKISTDNFSATGYTLYHESGSILFTSDPEWATQAPSLLADLFQEDAIQNQRLRHSGKTLLVNACSIPAINCVLVSHSDLGVILEPVRRSRFLWFITIIICIAASCFFANAFVNKLLKRADTINAAIRQIQQSNFDIALPVQGSDFLDQITENLNAMASRIKNLIQNNYEKQLQIKNLQIRMLSQQISPHFLYNTLECLKMHAILENDTETAQALTSLGRLLRYYANYSSKLSPVETELDEVQDYIHIMNLIEGRKCVFEKEVPDDFLSCPIPRFVLQPIVENSIKHGVVSCSSEIHICLTVKEENGLIYFIITDDGVGVSADIATQIQDKLRVGHTSYTYGNQQTSIGLYNTNARIKLIYGDQYGISFSSVQGLGTSVQFAIPASCQDVSLQDTDEKDDVYV
ncbi:sensor histidine kinase [Bianquea renquensis]|uniref:Histidine kinase n=1 Tax=Bianquea renquensis TaxID=2763661 RepID=A0A926HYE9_9FIRM|nr:histidine kinase [Bianquea renquensis]MBC8544772.1 histidine kinase [Bianquea renquensis]